MIDFPSNPELDEEYVYQYAYRYQWDGTKWVGVGRISVGVDDNLFEVAPTPLAVANAFAYTNVGQSPVEFETPTSVEIEVGTSYTVE